MDIVLLVGPQHCIIVKKTIRYLNKYVKSEKIYIVSKSIHKHYYSSKFCNQNNVIFLDEDKLLEGLNFNGISHLLKSHFVSKYNVGWYFQQFLKFGFALTPYARDNYLVWDADTIPTNEIIFSDNQYKYFTAKDEYHKPYFDTIYRLLGLNKNTEFSFIAEHMIFDTKIMRKMISDISQSEVFGNNWINKIICAVDPYEPNAFSEFETYGTYVMNKYPNLYKPQFLKTFRHAGIKYNRLINQKQIMQLSIEGYNTISLEENDSPKFPSSIIWLFLRIRVRIINNIFGLIYK